MEYFITFFIGIIVGAGIIFAVWKISEKKAQSQTDIAFEKMQKEMQLYFENIANRALKENSQEISTQNKERLVELLTPFR